MADYATTRKSKAPAASRRRTSKSGWYKIVKGRVVFGKPIRRRKKASTTITNKELNELRQQREIIQKSRYVPREIAQRLVLKF